MDKNTEPFTSIKFKPMSEGLGLNHFADGLPYAPSGSKKKKPVQFNYPPASPTQRGSMVAAPPPLTQVPVGSERARRVIDSFDAVETEQAYESESAGFIRRVFAYGIDVAFASAIFALIVWSAFTLNGYDFSRLMAEQEVRVQIFWPLTLLYLVVHMGYFLIQETTWRCTIGKAVMGIRIRSASGFAALGRAVCFFIAAIPFGVGLFWYFFDGRHRCWHDVITDSEVVLS